MINVSEILKDALNSTILFIPKIIRIFANAKTKFKICLHTKKLSELSIEDLIEYNEYKLCYVDESTEEGSSYDWNSEDASEKPRFVNMYFTSTDLKKQWGDDWDDAPYEHNAEIPYDDDGNEETEILAISVPQTDERIMQLPRDIFYCGGNSPLCVAQINSGLCAWIYISESGKSCDGVSAMAGESPFEVLAKLVKAKALSLQKQNETNGTDE